MLLTLPQIPRGRSTGKRRRRRGNGDPTGSGGVEDVCLKTVPGFCAIGEPLSGTSYMPESGGGRIERMEVPGIVRKLDRPRLSHVLN